MLCSHCGHWNAEAEHRCTRCGRLLMAKSRGSLTRRGVERSEVLPEPPPPEPLPEPAWKRELTRKLEGYRERQKTAHARSAVAAPPEEPPEGSFRRETPPRIHQEFDDRGHHVLLPDPPGARKEKAPLRSPILPPRQAEARGAPPRERPSPSPAPPAPAARGQGWRLPPLESHSESPAADSPAKRGPNDSESPRKQRAAPLKVRALAALMDLAVILMALGAFVGVAHLRGVEIGSPEVGWRPVLFAFFVILSFYWYFYVRYFGRTAGMTWLGLCVMNFDGEPPTGQQCRTRALGTILSAASLGMGFVWAIADEENLTWHDRLSKTYVAFEPAQESGD